MVSPSNHLSGNSPVQGNPLISFDKLRMSGFNCANQGWAGVPANFYKGRETGLRAWALLVTASVNSM